MFATTPSRTATRTRPTPFVYDRPAEILAVLQHARAIVEAGWVQNRWTATRPSPAATPGPAATAVREVDGGAVASACVVGAVALAVRARDPRADLAVTTGPALAHLWDAVHGAGPGRRGAAGRAAPPHERVARMRELARWNDERGRTRADVVAALDRAAARVVALAVDPVRT
ncbi:MAG TPA: hypothetical protein VF667_08325 [Pseudonocardia sp.]